MDKNDKIINRNRRKKNLILLVVVSSLLLVGLTTFSIGLYQSSNNKTLNNKKITTLKKEVFTSKELNLLQTKPDEISQIVNEEWFISNRNILFSDADNLKKEDIKKIEVKNTSSSTSNVQFEVNNEEVKYFDIVDLFVYELKQNSFKASDLGLSDLSGSKAIEKLDVKFIIENKEILFDDAKYLDEKLIENFDVSISGLNPSEIITISFKIKDYEYVLKITDFKNEFVLNNNGVFEWTAFFGEDLIHIDDALKLINDDWILKNVHILFQNIPSELIISDTKAEKKTSTEAQVTFIANDHEFKIFIVFFGLNKEKFEAKEFGMEQSSYNQAKQVIDENWIYENREILFNQPNSILLEHIKNIQITQELYKYTTLKISFNLVDEFYNIEITNFKPIELKLNKESFTATELGVDDVNADNAINYRINSKFIYDRRKILFSNWEELQSNNGTFNVYNIYTKKTSSTSIYVSFKSYDVFYRFNITNFKIL